MFKRWALSLIDIPALRALVAEEVRRELAAQADATDRLLTKAAADALWTAEDVAAFLKASRSWVYQQAEAGLLPCLKVRGLLRFDPAAVRAFACGEPASVTKVVSTSPKGP
jgi:Helix-turn-helix domain